MNKKLRFIPILVFSASLLTGCNLEANPDGPALMTAINYNEKQRIIYSLDDPYETPNKVKTYTKGDYKPVWEYIQDKLGITLLEHQAAANSGEKKSVAYFRDNWLNSQYADISMGTVNAITKYSVSGNKETILDLKPYLEQGKDGPLGNLYTFLEENPGLKMSIMTAKHSHPEQGAIYFVPYLDGFDDTERMMMARHDFITKLLDGDYNKFSETDKNILGTGSNAQYKLSYEPFITDKTYEILLPNVIISGENEGTVDTSKHEGKSSYSYKKKEVNKTIIERQNELIKEGKATSKALGQQYQEYIKERYFGVSGQDDIFTKNSDLFLGWKACFDADELVALMRLVKVSAKTLYGENDDKEMVTWFPTEWTNMRSSDLYRWGGQVFGVRGPESRTGYLYFKGNKNYGEGFDSVDRVHDCRGDQEMVNLIKILKNLYKEGLLLQNFDDQTAAGSTNKLFDEALLLEYKTAEGKKNKKYHGFMEYCFVNAESKYNDVNDDEKKTEDGTIFAPLIGAVSHWDTDYDEEGSDQTKWHQRDTYMQFTESWTSAKTSALCMNANLAKTPQKLANAFKLVNYIFSPEGKAVYNYGPEKYGYFEKGFFDKDGNPVPESELTDENSVLYKGKRVPKITAEAEKQNKEIDGVNRQRVGACLPFGYEKLNGLVFQQIREKSKPGVIKVNKAIECGTFRHTCIRDVYEEYPDLKEKSANMKGFYKIIPSSFFLTDGQNTDIARILDKTKLGSMYTDDNQSQFNIWDDYVMGKKSSSAPEFDKYLETVNGSWECPKLVTYYQDAYELMV